MIKEKRAFVNLLLRCYSKEQAVRDLSWAKTRVFKKGHARVEARV